MLRPVKTASVTTKEELDVALATADQITVEGDDELLSYAVNKAAGNPENRVAVQLHPGTGSGGYGGSGWRYFARTRGAQSPPISKFGQDEITVLDLNAFAKQVPPAPAPNFSPATPPPHPASSGRLGKLFRTVGWGFLILVGVGLFGQRFFLTPAPEPQRPPSPATPWENPSSPANPPPRSVDNTKYLWDSLPSLLWPLVAIVAIVALFLIARQAIASGSNVTISWKVTEKVTGRVVITKVRERAPGKRAA
jgi:hypothetical protein